MSQKAANRIHKFLLKKIKSNKKKLNHHSNVHGVKTSKSAQIVSPLKQKKQSNLYFRL